MCHLNYENKLLILAYCMSYCKLGLYWLRTEVVSAQYSTVVSVQNIKKREAA